MTPVTFSFGWVAYAFSFLLFIGDKRFMPEPDLPSIIINAESGYTRTNHNWVLGRILRDFDYWKPNQVRDVLKQILDDARRADVENAKKKGIEPPPPRERAGLCISIFCTIPIPTGITTQL